MLRMVPPPVQHALLFRKSHDDAWRRYLGFVGRMFFSYQSMSSSSDAIRYAVGSHCTRCWYVGKTNALRTANSRMMLSFVQRFREHLSATIRHTGTQEHHTRHRMWRSVPPKCVFFFMPFMFGSGKDILSLEAKAIATLRYAQPFATLHPACSDGPPGGSQVANSCGFIWSMSMGCWSLGASQRICRALGTMQIYGL